MEAFPVGASITLADLDHDPHPDLARLRASEPVSWIPALDSWLVTRYDLALQVMRDPDTFTVDDPRFSTAQVIGPSMLSLDGAEHERHRRPFTAEFRPTPVKEGLAKLIAGEADRLIDNLINPRNQGRAELRRAYAGPLAASTITRALGLAATDVADVLAWYDAIVASVTSITAGTGATAAGAAAFEALARRLSASVTRATTVGGTTAGASAAGATTARATTARATTAGASAAGASAAGASAAGLSVAEGVSNAAVLLFGGIETTEGMIANAVLHLLQRPCELDRVRREPALVDVAIEESLRLEPAAAVVDRYATADVTLGPACIAAGDLVRVSIAGANRDTAVFLDPDRFDLDRGARRGHLAFAHGPHVCLGIHLARLEARIALARLLERLPALRADPERPSTIEGLVFRKPRRLDVVF